MGCDSSEAQRIHFIRNNFLQVECDGKINQQQADVSAHIHVPNVLNNLDRNRKTVGEALAVGRFIRNPNYKVHVPIGRTTTSSTKQWIPIAVSVRKGNKDVVVYNIFSQTPGNNSIKPKRYKQNLLTPEI